MALNNRNYEFVNILLYVDGVKFHRAKFIKETWVQHWDCWCKKKWMPLPCFNKARKEILKVFKSFQTSLPIISKTPWHSCSPC